ncbi:PucR family transcriptional regulator [Streptomyces sp. R302]|uniref:helix-turn-helix domain-containing protein n=1 Tax=unclassified Streptomyces TaxID=2593676 RepID=UPI00145C963F|nr:PucR family transcriptional regulator [Streptomyces sp. R301]NML82506.1 PucR family transcriptional regulator [Streptomyces sp. R302]
MKEYAPPSPPPGPGGGFARTPWHELPPGLAALIRPRIDAIVAEMIEAIRVEVAPYRRPLESAVGRDLAESIRRALHQFAELIEHPDSPQDHHLRHFRELGRVEFRSGRTTDGIQAAFRVGARVGSRRYAEVLQAAALPAELVLPLHEAVLVHINALSNEAVAGFRAERLRSEGELKRARRTLAERLLEPPGPGDGRPSPEPLAERAGWPLPRTLACLLVRPGDGRLAVPGAETGLLSARRGNDLVLIVPLPEPHGDAGEGQAGPLGRIRTALRGRTAALGPAVTPDDAWLSLQCARAALDRRTGTGMGAGAGAVAGLGAGVAAGAAAGVGLFGGEFVLAEEELGELHLLRAAPVGRLLAGRVLAPLAELPRGRADRLAETLEALLMSWGRTAPEVARVLGVHPQTARRRLHRLDALFGERLADPAFRFEALLALRTRSLLGERRP